MVKRPMHNRIIVKIERCMGCHTCEIACAIAHSSSKDLITMVREGENPGYRVNVEAYTGKAVPINCQHCDEPACVMACPTGAIHRAGEGGPVLYDRERCIGCRLCVQACPFGVITVSPDGKRVLKCDLCVERLAQHKLPACVSACPTGALEFADSEASNREKRKKLAEQMVTVQEPSTQESQE
jgi:carbon-monoxide dehydrogenase iron sulfur subunit